MSCVFASLFEKYCTKWHEYTLMWVLTLLRTGFTRPLVHAETKKSSSYAGYVLYSLS
jgi:hypothetical protein